MSRFNPMIGVALFAIQSYAVAAQETPAPQPSSQPSRILPPIRSSLPPGEGSQSQTPAAPVQAPVVITPPAIETPAPRPKATPTPRATPKASPTPTPTPTATRTPEPTPSLETRTEAPIVADEVVPTPVPSPSSTPVLPSVDVEPEQVGSGGFRWLWWVGGIVALVGLAFLWWRRRQVEAVQIEAFEQPPAQEVMPEPVASPVPVPQPSPPAPAPEREPSQPAYLARPPAKPVVPAIPAGTITAFRDKPKPAEMGYITAFKTPSVPAPMLGIEVNPIRAGIADDAGFVEFQFAMLNPSDVGVSDMLVSAWILSANPEQDEQIRANLAEPSDPSSHNVYALKPGQHREHHATLGVPFDLLHVVEAGGRRFFAPMLLLDARYRSASGAPGRTSAAYMIGKPNPATGKLSPIYVDRGPRAVEGLAARPYPIAAMQG